MTRLNTKHQAFFFKLKKNKKTSKRRRKKNKKEILQYTTSIQKIKGVVKRGSNLFPVLILFSLKVSQPANRNERETKDDNVKGKKKV